MDNVEILARVRIGRNFIAEEFLPKGENEYYLRNRQLGHSLQEFRHLSADEIELLVRNNNTAESWDDILVTPEFQPSMVRDTDFYGLVRIGALRDVLLKHHDLKLPAGITKSRIISCDIGDDSAIHNVSYLSHYIIGPRCILNNIDEMHTTSHAKFGNGIIKEGEPEEVRVWIEIMNETGARKVLPFDGMLPADAYLWAKYRDDVILQKRLLEITQSSFDARRGYYGTVGSQCVIKNSRILKDAAIGDHCYIKGANKIKNVTINSSPGEPTQIGEGVELVNGIVGRGCHIFYGCKAVRFVLANNANLKYGARLINSFLGENSTISCCEVLHNLIFPGHEQHHNNSFLIASVVMGQSNIAAGATLGSNHNSRSNDNEIQAGRGFWPGLCTSVKHSCRFASFTLLSKSDYPAEMNITLPFSLVNNNIARDRLEVMPAYWWLFNMFALARNAVKYRNRDTRAFKNQHIEFDALAPDTVEEIIAALHLLERWTGKALTLNDGGAPDSMDEVALCSIGKEALLNNPEAVSKIPVLGENMEKSGRRVVILKPSEGYRAYRDMLWYYAIRNLVPYFLENSSRSFTTMTNDLPGERITGWTNLGGQIVPDGDVDVLRADIGSGKLDTWAGIHARYDRLWDAYPRKKEQHAFATLCMLCGFTSPDLTQWRDALGKAVTIQEYIGDQVYLSRKKDDDNPFRRATFRNESEMKATIGTAGENAFIKQVREDTIAFAETIEAIAKRS
ncbi:MAG: DUF4954 family protein [Chitinispirillaceae bacterium]|nr:DUF4954 family protein [Chitinispirillaceae bacterium]